GLLTADPELGAELTELFNHLTGYSRPMGYRMLLVAPESLRSGLRDRIRAQAALGPSGRIVMKMNSLVDAGLIDDLYDASRAGTPIDLVVRGSVACVGAGPGSRRRSASARSSVATSSTRASTASVPIPSRPTGTSAVPTSCPATSTAASRRWRRSTTRASARG